MNERRQSAFTIAELAAVLIATSIVLALAYSTYRTYIVRAQISEGIAAANQQIPRVSEYFRRHGDVPATLEGPPDPDFPQSAFVDAVTVIDGRIDVLYGGQADRSITGRVISLTPYETADGHVVWVCGHERPGPGLKPLGFAGGGRQAVRVSTTIDARYLSGPCRGTAWSKGSVPQ